MSWRILSAMIILGLVLVLTLFFTSDAFYVHSIAVGGLKYLTKEEVFALTETSNLHIFWVDPEVVRKNLLRFQMIADAQVTVGWPPNMVQIIVEEREPALIWVQSGTVYWIDLQGRVMPVRGDRPDLIQILADPDSIELDTNQRVPADVVNGALQLHELLPNVAELRYHPINGLGFRDASGANVWLGQGTDMPEKIVIYQAIAQNLSVRNIQALEINIVNPDAPFYCPLGAVGCYE